MMYTMQRQVEFSRGGGSRGVNSVRLLGIRISSCPSQQPPASFLNFEPSGMKIHKADERPFRGRTLDWHKQIVKQLRYRFRDTTGSKLISVNVHQDDSLINGENGRPGWASSSSDVDIISYHLPPDWLPDNSWNSLPQKLREVNKPLILSNDGHWTQSNLVKDGGKANTWPSDYRIRTRDYWTRKMFCKMYGAYGNTRTNLAGFEFLDKDLNKTISGLVSTTGDTTWLSNDYSPTADKFDSFILSALQRPSSGMQCQ